MPGLKRTHIISASTDQKSRHESRVLLYECRVAVKRLAIAGFWFWRLDQGKILLHSNGRQRRSVFHSCIKPVTSGFVAERPRSASRDCLQFLEAIRSSLPYAFLNMVTYLIKPVRISTVSLPTRQYFRFRNIITEMTTHHLCHILSIRNKSCG